MQDKSISLGEAQEVADLLEVNGNVKYAEPYGSGHINDTYDVRLSEGECTHYIFQRINDKVFNDIEGLMDNILRVTSHQQKKLEARGECDLLRKALTVIPSKEGRPFVLTQHGKYWRVYIFIEDALTYDVVQHNGQAYEAARAFGGFQRDLADLPAPALNETIKGFHDTPARLEAFKSALSEDAFGRAKECESEIDFVLGMEPETDAITRRLADGSMPLRVTHNDTKVNNVMLDDDTGEGICVIDLDTAMPGSIVYDFGDQVRTSCGHFNENERDLSKVFVDVGRFESIAKGYLSTAGSFLTDLEVELLVTGGILMTFEVGLRFLTDYLQGDVYFKTHRPGENLDRARTQLEFVRKIRQSENKLNDIVAKCR